MSVSSHSTLMRRSLAQRRSLVTASGFVAHESTVADALRDRRAYGELVCAIRDGAASERALRVVLRGCVERVAELGREARLLVEALFATGWPSASADTVDAFCEWTLRLLTAQIHHTPLAIDSLVKKLAACTTAWDETPPTEQAVAFSRVHALVAQIVSVIPMSSDILLNSTVDNFPYYKQPSTVNRAYVHNMLWISRYLPCLEDHLISLILNRLIIMDVNLQCYEEENQEETVFKMEGDAVAVDPSECLDLCMIEVFQWMDDKGPEVLNVLTPIFHNIILPTHGTNNVQFFILYALSRDVKRVPQFLDSLWQLIASARIGPGLRQAAVIHLTGLLARAAFITTPLVKLYISKMTEWCHSYINAQDNIRPSDIINPHTVFYSVCQSLFYLIAFKHKNLLYDKKGLLFMQSLNLAKIVLSSLNPLRYCHSGIAETFTSVTRIHQIVYCQTVMEYNARQFLKLEQTFNSQDWFPYDPYTLTKSSKWIDPIYKVYEEHPIESYDKNENCEEDDFLATSPSINFTPRSLNSIR